jgi:hypothetical protein
MAGVGVRNPSLSDLHKTFARVCNAAIPDIVAGAASGADRPQLVVAHGSSKQSLHWDTPIILPNTRAHPVVRDTNSEGGVRCSDFLSLTR